MQARLLVHTPLQAATARSLRAGERLRIGRAEGCDLRIDHPSVSRAHAELLPLEAGWRLCDLGSKNGSFVDGLRAQDAPLPSAGWLRFGDVHCEFRMLDADQAARDAVAHRERRAIATAHTARIDRIEAIEALLDASLRGAIELAQCERGFVLLREHGRLRVRHRLALAPEAMRAADFSGSVGAVDRALDRRVAVVANDIGGVEWLARRASVIAAGISALVCLPLLDGDEALGAIYVDRVRLGPPVTDLDLALLEAFAERAALWIAARRMRALLEAPSAADDALDWRGIADGHGGTRW